MLSNLPNRFSGQQRGELIIERGRADGRAATAKRHVPSSATRLLKRCAGKCAASGMRTIKAQDIPSPGRQFPGDLKEITREHADRVLDL